MKTYVVVDIEANGPIPGDYSMTSLGAVIVDKSLKKTFKINIKPISKNFDPNRIKFIENKEGMEAKEAMITFRDWLNENKKGKLVFISDNNGFDWMFICWYFWHFLGENPFGYSSQNLNSLYRGMRHDMNVKIDSLRSRKLTHDALEDAKDNARIFLKLKEKL